MTESVYVLLGPETGTKQTFLQEVLDALKKSHGSDLDVIRAFAAGEDIDELLARLRAPGLFSSHTLLVLYQAEAVFTSKALKEYLQDPSEGATLLLISDEVRLPSALDKVAKKHIPEKARRIFWEMFDDQKERWVHAAFSRRNMRIEEDAVHLLLDLVDNTTSAMEMQIDRVARAVDRSAVITEELLEEALAHTKEESPFGLFAPIVFGEITRVLENLERLLLQSDTTAGQITSALAWQYRQLALLREHLSRGVSEADAFTELKIRGKRNQGLFRTARKRLSEGDVETALTLIPEFEARLRSVSGAHHRGVLQELLYLLTARRPAKEMLTETVY